MGIENTYKLSEYIDEHFTEVVFSIEAGAVGSETHSSLLDVFGMSNSSAEEEEEEEFISNIEFTCALLVSDDKDEFVNSIKALAKFKYKQKITSTISNRLYVDYLSLLKISLSQLLFSEQNPHRVANHLKVLEKRLQFAKDNIDVLDVSNDIKLTFKVVKDEERKDEERKDEERDK